MSEEREQEACGLARAWTKTWGDAFVKHYLIGRDTTNGDGEVYPGADAIAYAVACANADTFADALAFTGQNAEERMKRAMRRHNGPRWKETDGRTRG